jgi:hypothetical protein
MLKTTIHVRGLEQFPGRPEVQQAIGRALRRGVRAIVVRAQRNLAGRYLRVRTGKLRRGMRSSVKVHGGNFIATVRNVVFYGHILESGAAAHLVKPKRGKFLRFEVAGRIVFARQVVHPGLRPRPWFRAAVIEALPELQRAFEQELGVLSTVHGRIAS